MEDFRRRHPLLTPLRSLLLPALLADPAAEWGRLTGSTRPRVVDFYQSRGEGAGVRSVMKRGYTRQRGAHAPYCHAGVFPTRRPNARSGVFSAPAIHVAVESALIKGDLPFYCPFGLAFVCPSGICRYSRWSQAGWCVPAPALSATGLAEPTRR
ncbi:hypothetical protein BDK51DRAFT_47389 [Blyttiomyces helicus]|uniref:Uncharacterized protein n=1 Tax=Blyttiomyces helicus TaxID=388810 RepID=A0A4P9W121_9FUNG|nr:hypothetical protein BDK51DRAFT_47389 [Blyttiomyces helicus]|eukprot:RKO83756.1 hypothetical protein BDK51DRAFT_47389 [Blyttiomyces helicus]